MIHRRSLEEINDYPKLVLNFASNAHTRSEDINFFVHTFFLWREFTPGGIQELLLAMVG